MSIGRTVRTLLAAATLALAGFLAAPAEAQAPINPTATSVKEQQLLNALKGGEGAVAGRVSIPDAKSANLIKPAGRDWSAFHQGTLRTVGGVAILGALLALAVFYLVRGRIRIDAGLSGVKILRFTSFERFTHWLTATCFMALALTGLNITFGKALLMPLIGPEAFATVTQLGKYAHNYLAWPFILGLVFMLLVWVKDNLPARGDMAWIKAGGGLLKAGHHPEAKKFNAGQKLVFWSVILGGGALAVSGVLLLFPFTFAATMAGMQLAQIVHGVVSVLLVAMILAHIYIGSVGMEGAFDAMGSGEVDLNWAREHHSGWVKETEARGKLKPVIPPSAVPAE